VYFITFDATQFGLLFSSARFLLFMSFVLWFVWARRIWSVLACVACPSVLRGRGAQANWKPNQKRRKLDVQSWFSLIWQMLQLVWDCYREKWAKMLASQIFRSGDLTPIVSLVYLSQKQYLFDSQSGHISSFLVNQTTLVIKEHNNVF